MNLLLRYLKENGVVLALPKLKNSATDLYRRNYRKGGKFLPDGTIKRFFFRDNNRYIEHQVSPSDYSMTKVEVNDVITRIVLKKFKGFISITKIWDIAKTKPKEIWSFNKSRICFNDTSPFIEFVSPLSKNHVDELMPKFFN